MEADNSEVKQNHEDSRFELALGDDFAFTVYRVRDDGVYVMTHTEVPRPYRGKGVADRLVAGMLAMVQAEGKQLVPQCPFVRLYIKRNPQWQSLVTEVI